MAVASDGRYYAEAEGKPKGLNKEDYQVAQDKLAAKAEGREYKVPEPPKGEQRQVRGTGGTAAESLTIAEGEKAANKK